MAFYTVVHSILDSMRLSVSNQQRKQQLVQYWQTQFKSDACVLLQLKGHTLYPRAAIGVGKGFSGRHFALDEHPRLQQILAERSLVRFPKDSPLPDPYDGLLDTPHLHLPIHDCMGITLLQDDEIWGVLTLDALNPHAFDQLHQEQWQIMLKLTEAVIRFNTLVEQSQQEGVFKEKTEIQLTDAETFQILGNSAVMQSLRAEIELLAPSDFTTLILGESGTGKELVAHALHQQSYRCDEPFITVNCAALPENLVESELFGHVRGAFSGAEKDRLGKFELAQGGTLFLDEVGELPLNVQAKLLRALQNGDIQRLGSDQHHKVNVRIVAATNRDLVQWVKEGKFRADLFHRLSVYPVQIPPLRERGYDILLLAAHYLSRLQQHFKVNNFCLTPQSETLLLNYAWEGNVRELEHVLSRVALKALRTNDVTDRMIFLTPDMFDLPKIEKHSETKASEPDNDSLNPMDVSLSLRTATDQFQRQYIQTTLQQTSNNKAEAARRLGVDRGNFSRLLKRLSLE